MKSQLVKTMLVALVGIAVLVNLAAGAELPSVMLQKGIYQEDTVGDLETAMTIYREIIQADDARRAHVARAIYRLGNCYAKKGDQDKAAELYAKVIRQFPERKSIVSKAKRALKKIRPQAAVDNGTPLVVSTNPAVYANDVPAEMDKLSVTFNQPMMDKSWAWVRWNYQFPDRTDDSIYYDESQTTCYLPVKLKPGQAYLVMLNARPKFMSFMNKKRVTSEPYVLVFATKDKDGNPTEIPAEMLAKARSVNKLTNALLKSKSKLSTAETSVIVNQAVMTISTCAEGDPRVKASLESLKGLDQAGVVKELVEFLDADKDTVRRSAIYILWRGEFGSIAPAVDNLLEFCGHQEHFTRGMAALALGQNKAAASFDTLCKMTLDDDNGYARRCGAYALGLLGNPAAKETLEKAAKDSDFNVRNNAEAALTMLEQVSAEQAPVTDADKRASGKYSGQGWKLWQQRKLKEAEEKFEKAVKLDPTNANAWNGLGWAQFNQGKNKNAQSSFEKCLKYQPNHAGALNGMGWVAKKDGNTDEAIEYWEKAVKAIPGATAALNGLTQTYMETQQYDQAVKYYKKWLKAEPGNKDAQQGLKKAQDALGK